ncbi:MAG: sterol desaturase family protein [Pseudomonadota bacterium]
MDWFFTVIDEAEIYSWETWLGDWFFFLSFALLAFELIRYLVLRRFSWSLIGDSLTNYLTLTMFIGVNYVLLAGVYLATYAATAKYALFDIPSNWASVAICLVLADLAYYWEHRFTHRVNLAWATHSVHHSSPHFNISVAYRFGPMDGVWPVFFHLPLVLFGFNPFVVFFAEMLVQLYQTALHTEVIRKLPRPIEFLFNTPSHHRVHHGSNRQYLDANYGGIFIIWDRLFGTCVEEEQEVTYGLVKPIPEINSVGRFVAAPFVAFLHGFWRIALKLGQARNPRELWMSVFGPPEWQSERQR